MALKFLKSHLFVAAVMAATSATVVGDGQAQAQSNDQSKLCEDPGKVCASAMPTACRQRVGAGSMAANGENTADVDCETAATLYYACLQQVATQCDPAASPGVDREAATPAPASAGAESWRRLYIERFGNLGDDENKVWTDLEYDDAKGALFVRDGVATLVDRGGDSGSVTYQYLFLANAAGPVDAGANGVFVDAGVKPGRADAQAGILFRYRETEFGAQYLMFVIGVDGGMKLIRRGPNGFDLLLDRVSAEIARKLAADGSIRIGLWGRGDRLELYVDGAIVSEAALDGSFAQPTGLTGLAVVGDGAGVFDNLEVVAR